MNQEGEIVNSDLSNGHIADLKKVEDLVNEPYRVCRRVNILRDYPDDKIKIYP